MVTKTETLEKEKCDLTVQVNAVNKEKDDMKTRHNRELDHLEEKINNLEKERESIEKEKQEAADQVQNLRTKQSENEDKIDKVMADIDTIKNESTGREEELQAEVKRLKSINEKVQLEKSELELKIKSLTMKQNEMELMLNEARIQLEGMKKTCDEIKEKQTDQCNQAEKVMKEKEALIAKRSEEIRIYKTQLKEIKEDREKMRVQNEDLLKDLVRMKKTYRERLDDLEEGFSSAQGESNKMKMVADNLQYKQSTLNKSMEAIITEEKNIKTDQENFRSSLIEFKEKLQGLTGKVDTMEIEKNRLVKNLKEKQLNIDKFILDNRTPAKITDHTNRLRKLEQDEKEARRDVTKMIEKLTTERDGLANEMGAMEETVEMFSTKEGKLSGRYKSLKQGLEDIEYNKMALQREIETFQTSTNQLDKKLTQSAKKEQEIFKQLEEATKELKKEHAGAKQGLIKFEENIKKMRREIDESTAVTEMCEAQQNEMRDNLETAEVNSYWVL